MRGSRPIASRTGPTSAPECSASPAISLANEIFRARNALAPFLMSSASSRLTSRSGPPNAPKTSTRTASAVRSDVGDRPMTTRVGLAKSASAVPWARNSGTVKNRGSSRTWPSRRSRCEVPRASCCGRRRSVVARARRGRPGRPRQRRRRRGPGRRSGFRHRSGRSPRTSSRRVVQDREGARGEGGAQRLLDPELSERHASVRAVRRGGRGSVSTSSIRWPIRGQADGADEADIPGPDDRDGTR